MRSRILTRWSALLFVVGTSTTRVVSAADFQKLVSEYYKKRGECKKKHGDCTQKYVEDVNKLVVEENGKLNNARDDFVKCTWEVRKKFSVYSHDYREKALKCSEDFDKDVRDKSEKIDQEVFKKRDETRSEVRMLDSELDQELMEISNKAGYLQYNEQEVLRTLQDEQTQAKKDHERLLRQFQQEFNDTICIDIYNVKRELYPHEADYLANPLRAFLSKDLTDNGLDYYTAELSLLNQTVDGIPPEGTRGGTASRQLITRWGARIGCYRCLSTTDSDCVNCRRNLAQGQEEVDDREEENLRSTFHRDLQDADYDLPTVEAMVQNIFETRLKDMKEVATEETYVEARPCGVWPITDPVLKVNPVLLQDLEEFKEAHSEIAVKEQEETQKYTEDVEKENAKHQETIANEELKYMSCMNDADEKFRDRKVNGQQRKWLYADCFEKFDSDDNDKRIKFYQNVGKKKGQHDKKMLDLLRKMTDMLTKLNLEVSRLASAYLAQERGALEEEKRAQMKTQEEIEREQRKLQLKFNEGIVCNIENLKRPFWSDEIPILTGLVQRGANYAFDMCDIDLHMYDARFLEQEFTGERRLEHDTDSSGRNLKQALNIRFDSGCECNRCTVCESFTKVNVANYGTCDCCLRRRLFTDESYRRAQATECFGRYLNPRVKKLIEHRLKGAMEDDADEVYIDCSVFDLTEESR